MSKERSRSDAALGRFLRRVWKKDVEPLLRDRRARQRRRAARAGGRIAATGGLVLDSLLGLRGRPFTRAMTVMGSSLGALLPDVWDWKWLRGTATEQQRRVVREQVKRRAAELPEVDALELFGLNGRSSRTELKAAWRAASQRWHPDKAADEAARAEHHVRFIAYQAAYRRLAAAYEEGRLPQA